MGPKRSKCMILTRFAFKSIPHHCNHLGLANRHSHMFLYLFANFPPQGIAFLAVPWSVEAFKVALLVFRHNTTKKYCPLRTSFWPGKKSFCHETGSGIYLHIWTTATRQVTVVLQHISTRNQDAHAIAANLSMFATARKCTLRGEAVGTTARPGKKFPSVESFY